MPGRRRGSDLPKAILTVNLLMLLCPPDPAGAVGEGVGGGRGDLGDNAGESHVRHGVHLDRHRRPLPDLGDVHLVDAHLDHQAAAQGGDEALRVGEARRGALHDLPDLLVLLEDQAGGRGDDAGVAGVDLQLGEGVRRSGRRWPGPGRCRTCGRRSGGRCPAPTASWTRAASTWARASATSCGRGPSCVSCRACRAVSRLLRAVSTATCAESASAWGMKPLAARPSLRRWVRWASSRAIRARATACCCWATSGGRAPAATAARCVWAVSSPAPAWAIAICVCTSCSR